MAWEWIAPVSSAVVAIGGIAAGMFSTRWSQQHQRVLAAEQREGARTDDHRRWLRDRRAESYVEILRLAEELKTMINEPAFTAIRNPLEVIQKHEAARAAVEAYGSAEVRHLVLGWRVVTTKALQAATKQPRSEDLTKWQDEEDKIRTVLGDAIRRDLSDPNA